MKVLLLALLMGTTACAFLREKEDVRVATDRADLQEYVKTRDEGDPASSLDEVRDFIRSRPDSVYLQAARWYEARNLEDLGRAAEAEPIYRDVREKTAGREPQLAVLSEWRLSFTAEALGDDARAMAHLLGAERRKTDLPEQIAAVELPARKAMLAYRLGQDEAGESAFREAERGLRALLAKPGPKPDESWLAKLYLEMGRSRAESVNADNFTRFLKAQRVSQPYLLKAMRTKDVVAAPAALEVLRGNYSSFWRALAKISVEDSGDALMNARLRREKRIPLLAELLKVMEEAQAVRPAADSIDPREEEFYDLIGELSSRARAVLYATTETTILTEESRLLNGLRRGSRPAPADGKKTATDPNL